MTLLFFASVIVGMTAATASRCCVIFMAAKVKTNWGHCQSIFLIIFYANGGRESRKILSLPTVKRASLEIYFFIAIKKSAKIAKIKIENPSIFTPLTVPLQNQTRLFWRVPFPLSQRPFAFHQESASRFHPR